MADYSKCMITRYPTPVLSQPAKEIGEITDEIRVLAERMKDIMVETEGVGLAGPQAGVDLRIFVASPDATRESAKVYINPTIRVEGPLVSHEEGCLSLPGIWGKIKRYAKCTVTAQDEYGQEFTEVGEGLLARIFQHEYDHLEGRMIKDRLSQPAKIRARKRLSELENDYNDGSESL